MHRHPPLLHPALFHMMTHSSNCARNEIQIYLDHCLVGSPTIVLFKMNSFSRNYGFQGRVDLREHLDSRQGKRNYGNAFKRQNESNYQQKRGRFSEESRLQARQSWNNVQVQTDVSSEAFEDGLKQVQEDTLKFAEKRYNDNLKEVLEMHALEFINLKKESQMNLDELTKENNDLTKKVEDSQDLLKRSANDVQDLHAKIKELHDLYSKKVSGLEVANKDLSNQLTENEKRLKLFDKSDTKFQNLMKVNSDLKDKVANLKELIDEKNLKIINEVNCKEEMQNALSESRIKCARLESLNLDLTTENELLLENLELTEAKGLTLVRENDDLKMENTRITVSSDEKDSALNYMKKVTHNLENACEDHIKEKREFSNQIYELKKFNSDLQVENRKLKDDFDKQNDFKSKSEEMKLQIDYLRLECQTYLENVTKKDIFIKELEEKVSEMVRNEKMLKQIMDQLKRKNANFDEEILQLKVQNTQLQDKVKEKDHELKNVNKAKKNLELSCTDYEKQIFDKDGKYSELKIELDRKNAQLQGKIRILKRDKEKLVNDNNDLKQGLNQKDQKLREMDNVEEENTKLKDKLDEMSKIFEEQSKQIDKLKIVESQMESPNGFTKNIDVEDVYQKTMIDYKDSRVEIEKLQYENYNLKLKVQSCTEMRFMQRMSFEHESYASGTRMLLKSEIKKESE